MSKNTDFEKSLNELEKIVEELQNGDISLDESIKLFEKGIELTNDCRKTLETARQKITSLTEEEQKNGDK
ncbi:MAG: exodeoxyribonuclease VII small subunit [Acutalibacteraceae bacterium]|nr:exodeoxyribonuclease VII small subunit [Acutalibacteraceae bacterium]